MTTTQLKSTTYEEKESHSGIHIRVFVSGVHLFVRLKPPRINGKSLFLTLFAKYLTLTRLGFWIYMRVYP